MRKENLFRSACDFKRDELLAHKETVMQKEQPQVRDKRKEETSFVNNNKLNNMLEIHKDKNDRRRITKQSECNNYRD